MKEKYFFGLILIIFTTPFLMICIVPKAKTIYVSTNANFKSIGPHLSIRGAREKYQNKDILAYLEISGTDIHDFITQKFDNAFYLNHDVKKNKSIFGNVFMDYRNTLDDKQINLYGHNGNNIGAPFYDLNKLKKKSFYQKNNYITLTNHKKSKKYQIFSVIITNREEHMILKRTDTQQENYLDFLKKESLYETEVHPTINDKILILQTCTYEKENTYLLVCAKELKGERV